MAAKIEFTAVAIEVTVNHVKHEAVVEPRTLLVYFLRDYLNLTGTHVGCDTSQCGACTIQLNGRAVKSCTIFAVQGNGAEITTIEGLSCAGAQCFSPSGAGGVSGKTRPPVRLLHAGNDHDRRELAGDESESDGRGNPPRVGRQLVPLHWLREYRRIDSLGGGKDGRQKCFP